MAQYEILIKTDISDKENRNLAIEKEQEAEKDLAKEGANISNALKYAVTTMAKSTVMSVVPELVRDARVSQAINFGMTLAQSAIAFAVNPAFGAASLAISVGGDLLSYTLASRRERIANTVDLQRAGYLNRSR